MHGDNTPDGTGDGNAAHGHCSGEPLRGEQIEGETTSNGMREAQTKRHLADMAAAAAHTNDLEARLAAALEETRAAKVGVCAARLSSASP